MSKISLSAWSGSALGRSTLLSTTIGRRPRANAFDSTNLVCGIAPSAASTSSTQPSTMPRMRSTSPPKSAWPGVSTMLRRYSSPPLAQWIEVHLARMVMPRSRSWALESIARSAWASLARKAPPWASIWSTSVVLPWSTWAMIARLRRRSAIWGFLVSEERALLPCGQAALQRLAPMNSYARPIRGSDVCMCKIIMAVQ